MNIRDIDELMRNNPNEQLEVISAKSKNKILRLNKIIINNEDIENKIFVINKCNSCDIKCFKHEK